MWKSLLGRSRAGRRASSLALTVVFATSASPGFALAEAGSRDDPQRHGPSVGLQATHPVLPTTHAPGDLDALTAADATIIIEIISTDFEFSPSSTEIPPGARVTLRLINAGVVPHNINIPDLGVFVQAEAGATEEITFTTADATTTVEFLCNVPGHPESGMTGEITVTPNAVISTPVALTDNSPIAAASSLIPPAPFGESDGGFGIGALVVPFLGLLLVALIASTLAFLRLSPASDDEQKTSQELRPSSSSRRKS